MVPCRTAGPLDSLHQLQEQGVVHIPVNRNAVASARLDALGLHIHRIIQLPDGIGNGRPVLRAYRYPRRAVEKSRYQTAGNPCPSGHIACRNPFAQRSARSFPPHYNSCYKKEQEESEIPLAPACPLVFPAFYPCSTVSSSRRSTRRTLPEMVLGSSSINSTRRGYLYGAVSDFTWR
ncbi:hypothetical protein D3C75_540050 [compost metagenome]